MDIRITKKRLNDHLSYDWWKYLALIVASIFLWSLVFTMASPRLSNGKKMELYFIADGYNSANGETLRNTLKGYLSDEIVEIAFYNYVPNDSTTSQVLSARIGVGEGDLYMFGYSSVHADNSFGSYVDNGLFAAFDTVIDGAIEYGSNVMEYEEFKEQVTDKKIDTEEEFAAEYLIYTARCQRFVAEAETLRGYMENRPELFLSYARFTVAKSIYEDTEDYEIEAPKVWGLDFNAFRQTVTDTTKGGILYGAGVDADTGTAKPLNYAFGITNFKKDNMPQYYENIAVINFFIQKFVTQEL